MIPDYIGSLPLSVLKKVELLLGDPFDIAEGKIDPLEGAYNLGAYYKCPTANGVWLGNLMGYAKTYEYENKTLQMVGPDYLFFGKIEEDPALLLYHGALMARKLKLAGLLNEHTTFIGQSYGGTALTDATALVALEGRLLKSEKKVTRLKTDTLREQSEPAMSRHQIFPEDEVIVGEDVFNNMSTLEKMITIVEKAGANIVALMGYFNRSKFRTSYELPSGQKIPIISIANKELEQSQQHDPRVLAHLQRGGKIVLKPKDTWTDVIDQMRQLEATLQAS